MTWPAGGARSTRPSSFRHSPASASGARGGQPHGKANILPNGRGPPRPAPPGGAAGGAPPPPPAGAAPPSPAGRPEGPPPPAGAGEPPYPAGRTDGSPS